MSGHSKWSNIKNKKAAEDQKKGKIFSKLSRNIRAAVREGGGDPDSNVSLRLWLDKAREANMPKDNIQRAIDAGLGKGANGSLQEMIYEGFGPGGVGMLIISFTDNKNRTTAEVRNILQRSGGSLGSPGSAKYMFERSDQGKYKPTLALPLDDQQKKSLTLMVEELLELEDIEAVYCAAEGMEELVDAE
jgi:YebC/PmpR family DNA-binding regulatory protein